ncbi:glucosamine-6-phosphate deaminase [Panacibacter sp. DH6]|uniref:Glucosamine-6-phosphate deaminase n=1 Tax=Panacibacter microcysteis TaxID=2793269 RepID=A0A931E322_9BACT|nr:glucosamine-6-phosphate deaminase [Panacibacter microcysteis]MBG9376695.1 glucosamine-6-phosphate deaminase [Panacibacter microcysteis]
MEILIDKDYEAMSLRAANAVAECIKRQPDAVICLASGDTPKRMCTLLAEKIQSTGIDISQCSFIGLDEWVGIPPENAGSCSNFFHTYLFNPLQLPASQYYLFDAMAGDLQQQCDLMNAHIAAKGGIDLMMVGVGMNGHIGFNEPGVSIDNHAHVIVLDELTQTVGQKYFNGPVTIDKGITLGLQNLLEARQVIMIANGAKKAPVIKRAVHDEISTSFPATIMRMHTNSILMLDEAAAATI